MKGKRRAIKTDWAKVDATPGVPDDEIPEVTDEMLERAVYQIGSIVLPMPRKRGGRRKSGKK
jgi:hypothetical protein